jgi:hypothetical protein
MTVNATSIWIPDHLMFPIGNMVRRGASTSQSRDLDVVSLHQTIEAESPFQT